MAKKIGIIGAGPGGYVCAIKAAQLGFDVVLTEKDTVGGTCLNRGCIPTKTFFKTAELMKDIKRSETFAIFNAGSPKVDGKKLQERKREIVGTLVGGIKQLLSSYPNLKFYEGFASFEDKKTLKIRLKDGSEIIENDFDNIIIASGSVPKMTETEGVDLEGVITSDDLLELEEIPESLIVVGAGVIGLEFASIYQELGSQVTLLASRILKGSDKEMQKRLVPTLKKQGVKVYTDIRAKKITKEGELLRVVAAYKEKDGEETVEGKYVLIASGRGPVIEDMGFEKIGIKTDENGIIVNEKFETSVPGIFAIGDVNRIAQLAHVASAQGEWVMDYISGNKPEVNVNVYPSCCFTMTEVSYTGKTEEELKSEGVSYKVSKFNFAANGKALSLGEGEGLVKVLTDDDGKILGVHIIGPHANDLISEGNFAIANGLSVEDITFAIHAHPTLSEAFLEASGGIFEKSIHSAPKKKRK